VQVRALLDVLDQAVAAQPAADAAVAACGAPDGPTGQAAQDCGRVCSAFHRLRAELHGLVLTAPDLARAQAHAGRLLAYDQWMVHQALNLAFSVHPEPRTEAARLQLNGLGRPADDLRRLRDGLRAAQGAPGPAAAPRPGGGRTARPVPFRSGRTAGSVPVARPFPSRPAAPVPPSVAV
jgi:hypothetical protein